MNIEVAPHPDSPLLLSIVIDGEPWRTIHTGLFGKRPALPSAGDLSLFEEEFKSLEINLAKKYALNCLARKQYLSYELRNKLTQLLASENAISQALAYCSQLGYVNDKEMIQQYVDKLSSRSFGPQAIISKLRQKGVPASQIPSLKNPSSQFQQIQHILETRYKSRDLSNPKEKQKAVAYLARRGFNFSTIFEAINKIVQ